MRPSNAGEDIQTFSYEQAFAELEIIVASLESNQKTLDEAIALYERGQALSKRCASLLDQAELRVRQINGQPPGSFENGE